MKVEIKADVSIAVAVMRRLQDRLPKVMEVAVNKTAGQARARIEREMPVEFDRPTPYTKRAIQLVPADASRDRPSAEVKVRDDWMRGGPNRASSWLQPQIEGGPRRIKRFERALQHAGLMPTGWLAVPATEAGSAARFDAYGNVSPGQIVQILSQLRAGNAVSPLSTGTDRRAANSRRRAYGRAGGQFVAFPWGRGKLKPGIYLVEARDFGPKLGLGRSGRIRPVFLFVRRAAYAVNFEFYRFAQEEVAARLQPNVRSAISAELAFMARKGL